MCAMESFEAPLVATSSYINYSMGENIPKIRCRCTIAVFLLYLYLIHSIVRAYNLTDNIAYVFIRTLIKDGTHFCYCAYVLRISRYSGFLWVVPTNTGIFLRGLKLCVESRTLEVLLVSKMKIGGSHAFFRDNKASI